MTTYEFIKKTNYQSKESKIVKKIGQKSALNYWANLILERGGIFTNLSKTDKASNRLFLNEFDY